MSRFSIFLVGFIAAFILVSTEGKYDYVYYAIGNGTGADCKPFPSCLLSSDSEEIVNGLAPPTKEIAPIPQNHAWDMYYSYKVRFKSH